MTDWTKPEVKRLIDQYSRGTDMAVIGRLLPDHTETAIIRQVERLHLRRDPALTLNGSRVGYFDIETNGLKANFHLVLCWYIKERGTDHYDRYTLKPSDFARKDKTKVDYECVKRLVSVLKQYDIIVTYYGTMFDIPFTRTRALYHNIPYPPFGSIKHEDLYFKGRGKLCLHSKRLEVVSKWLDIPGKTPLDGSIWVGAGLGDTKSLRYVSTHCKADVDVLEKTHNRLLPYLGVTRRSI